MSVVKNILLAVAAIAVLYFAPQFAPQIGQFLGASGFLASAIGSIVIAAGVTILQSLLISRPQASSMDAGKVNVRIPEPPRWLTAGRMRQGGSVLFAEFDSAGNLWFLVVHSDSILTDLTDVQYYLDDVEITVNGSGQVLTKDFRLVGKKKDPATSDGAGDPYVQIWTTTYTESNPVPARIAALDAAFPSKWTADHKLVGTTFSVIKMNALKIEDRYKIYKWRGPLGLGEPAIGIVGKWSNVFDPRDGTQTNGTPTTYKYRRNSVLLWAWFRTHRYGRNKARSSINWTRIAEQAALCDQTVTGLVGDHVRYQCDIAVPDNKERVQAEQEILMSMDAQLVFDDDGKCWPRVGHWETPTLNLTRNRDIVAMESVEAQNGESETQGVIVRYVDPEANYTAQPSAPWYNPLYYVEGQSNTFLTVDVLACQDHNQAMRLAKSIGMRSQPMHKILPTVGLRGLKARQERFANLNYDNTFAGDYEIVTPVEVDPVGIFCGFGMVPVDADRWTLLPGEEKAKPVITDYDTLPLPAAPSGVVLAYKNNRIEATFTAPGRNDVGYEFQYIQTSLIGTADEKWSDMFVQMEDLIAYSGGVKEATGYSVQYRAVSSSGRATPWSSPPTTLSIGVTIDPVTLLSVVIGSTSNQVSWRNPTNANFGYVDVYRGTTNVFGSATKIVDAMVGGLGQVQQITDTVSPGTYYYWVVARATDGTSATATGPVSGTTIFDFSAGSMPSGASFSRSSSATYWNASSVLTTASTNVPRFDYNPATAVFRGLLIEPSRINLTPKSTDPTDAGWIVFTLTKTTGQADPASGSNAALYTGDGTSNFHISTSPDSPVTNGTTYTLSVLVKPGTAAFLQMYGRANSFDNSQYANFSFAGAGSVTANVACTATIEKLVSGWWRISITAAANATVTDSRWSVVLVNSGTGARNTIYTSSETFTLYGAQIEAGSYASSFMPTTTGSATRAADTVTLNWSGRGVADGTITVRYYFDDGTTQDVSTTVAGGNSTIPTNLNRRWIKTAAKV